MPSSWKRPFQDRDSNQEVSGICHLNKYFCLWKLRTWVARRFNFKPIILFWVNFEGLWIRKCGYVFWSFGTFHCHLVYFMANWLLSDNLVYISRFGILCQEKSGNPGSESSNHSFENLFVYLYLWSLLLK
jgi:hypothetical protein